MKSIKWTAYIAIVLFTLVGAYVLWQAAPFAAISRLKALIIGNTPQAVMALPFEYVEIDSAIAGDVKLVGDIDGDDFPDLVIGGMPNEKLNWYRYPDWQKTEIAVPNTEFTTDGALGDVDGDSDLDIVVPDGISGNNVVWFENPRPTGDPLVGGQWTRHEIGPTGSWAKDVELADYDDNGRLDVATRRNTQAMIFFQNGDNTWSQMDFSGVTLGSEGMASGDIDQDNDIDLVLRGVWVENPGGSAAQTAANWNEHTIGAADSDFKALVVDLNQDGKMDVLFSSSENTADVNWWTPTTDDPTGSWTMHTILNALNRAHTLQAADMDRDGDTDVVVGQMHTSSAKELLILYNTNGQALSWQQQVVATSGLHNGVVADIGNDGDYDIYGANWTGNAPVKLWVNRLDPPPGGVLPLNRWTYKEITSSHVRTFGLAFGDMDNDGLQDIVSGLYWYRNPGADMLGNWVQTPLPTGMHAFLALNVDDDNSPDLIAQKDEGDIALYWLEATDSNGTNWDSVKIGTVDRASHALGAQGYRSDQIEAGGKPEVLISSGMGIYYFRIPNNPEAGNWPRVHVNANPSDEGFALADIDGDTDLDIAGTTGNTKRVEWYENPGNGTAGWTAYHIGSFDEALFPDRTEVADLNNDGRIDIIVTEENGKEDDAQTFWWQQPEDPTSASWSRHLLTTQATTNNMDVADMDLDGDTDVILAEHRGPERITIWANVNDGSFIEQVVSSGKESHLGARVVDLDGDGDLDIVSIAFDQPQLLHLWRNDAPDLAMPTPTPTPDPQATPTVTPTPTVPPTPRPTRTSEGVQILYTFAEGEGTTVHDVSGEGSPLDLAIAEETAVAWIAGGGLAVNEATIITAIDPATKLLEACQATDAITIEAWIKPANTQQSGPARIVTFSQDTENRNFTLGQEGGAYLTRLRTTETSDSGLPSVDTGSNVAGAALTHVVYTRSASGEAKLYVDAMQQGSAGIGGNFSNWEASYQFALANELSGNRPWVGELHLVAVFDRALSANEVQQNFLAGPRVNLSYLPSIRNEGNSSFGEDQGKQGQGSGHGALDTVPAKPLSRPGCF